MKHNLNVPNFLSLIEAICLISMVFILTSGFVEPPKTLPVGTVPDNIKSLLADYSQNLNNGKSLQKSYYSSAVETLVQERRDYYNEYYITGLHTNLTSIKSKFHLETAKVTTIANVYHIELIETVTTFGYPNLSKAEDYPMIPAAYWAISNTDNDNIKQALDRYIASTTDAINYSIANGAETVFRVHHKIDIRVTGGKPQIIKDEFTDKEIDNGKGSDNVNWLHGNPVRKRPDLTQMLGYEMYHTSIEILGKQLLTDYANAYSNESRTITATNFTYGRGSAKNYAYKYVGSDVTTTCSYGGKTYFMDTLYYNQIAAYKAMWQYTTTTCNDCADYISQALRQGGFPIDNIWKFTPTTPTPPGKRAWRVSDYYHLNSNQGLFYWLDNTWGATTQFTSAASLQLGDLITDSYYAAGVRKHGAGHVVMVTQITAAGPYFSGHTNDRKNAVASGFPTLKYYWHIKDYLFQ